MFDENYRLLEAENDSTVVSDFVVKIGCPVVVYSRKLTPRVKAQSSFFTVSGGKYYNDSDNDTSSPSVDRIPKSMRLIFLGCYE